MPSELLFYFVQEQVEAARKDIDQAKDEVVFKLPEDEDESYLLEETSSKKSKKAKTPSRGASERTGTRMSERLRSIRLPPREGDSGDVESSQARLSSLRHPRVMADEDDDTLPQVAQHTRGAAVRRELGREEKAVQVVLNTRRTVPRREEPWTKVTATGERLQKVVSQRTEASLSGDRVLRTNPHKTETLSVGDKVLQVAPQKMDAGAASDRVLKGSPPKTEAQPLGGKLPESSPQITDSGLDKALRLGPQKSERAGLDKALRLGPNKSERASGLDKALRLGPQKSERASGLDKLQSSSPTSESSVSETLVSQIHPQELDAEVNKLKADTKEQKRNETPQLNSSAPIHIAKNLSNMELPVFQAEASSVDEGLLEPQTSANAGKTIIEIPATEEMASNLVPRITAPELYCENKPEPVCEIEIPLSEQKESLHKPEKEMDMIASYGASEQELVNSVDEASRKEAAQEVAPSNDGDRKLTDVLPIKCSGEAAVAMPMLDSETPKAEVPIFTSFNMAAASSVLHVETLPCVKEQNGLQQPLKTKELPCLVSDLAEKPHPEISTTETAVITTEAASRKSSLSESPKQGQGIVEKNLRRDEHQVKEGGNTTISLGAVSLQESPSTRGICPGAISSDESLSPIKAPRRRTSADVQIRQSCQDQDGPSAKVLRKLPGRLVTVVEEKELIRRRRNRVRKLDVSDSVIVSPRSAQSVSESESSSSGKELPLLRDLPARRRIEMESRAAAKERDESSRGELFVSPSTEPVKRKRGRPPKNKALEQQSPVILHSSLEPTLEDRPQSRVSEQTVPETQPQSKTSEQKMPETQIQIKDSEPNMPHTQSQSKISEGKVPEIQPQIKNTEQVSETQLQRKASEQKLPELQPQNKTTEKKVSETQPPNSTSEQKVAETQSQNKTPEQKLSKTSAQKTESLKRKSSSLNDSPVEKKRRGRPPKIRESLITSSKTCASKKLSAPSAKPYLPPKMQKQLKKSCGSTSVTETSKIHESVDLAPKTTLVSKTSPKARNRMSIHPKSMSLSKPTPEPLELLATPPKSLSKSSTEACENLATPPRVVSITETSTEMQEKSSLLPLSHMPSKAFPLLDSPPKRKRGRPPKNPPSPRVEAEPPPASSSDQEASPKMQTLAPPVHKQQRRKRKDELGPSLPGLTQSSLESEDTRPLTRLSWLKRDEKPESCTESLVQSSPKHVVVESASSAESTASEQLSSDAPARSTRLRPGSLVPPLERETQRRKRHCSSEGSRVSDRSQLPAPQAPLEQEGRESESSLKSSESSGNNCVQQPKHQCCEAGGRGRGRGRRRHHHGGMADRILRSAAKPADSAVSAPSPAPTRKAGSGSASAPAGGVPGVVSPSSTPSPAAPVTSSLSNRGRKPKT